MTTLIADNRLVLYPTSPQCTVSGDDLQQALRNIEFIQDGFNFESASHFLVGERFLEHLSFLGCSPHINIEPPVHGQEYDTEFCHVSLQLEEKPVFLAGSNLRAPACPACKKRSTAVPAIAVDGKYIDSKHEWQCPHCGQLQPFAELNWRRTAAVSQCAIHLWGIHESEAVPNESLMRCLREISGCEWDYFYRVTR